MKTLEKANYDQLKFISFGQVYKNPTVQGLRCNPFKPSYHDCRKDSNL